MSRVTLLLVILTFIISPAKCENSDSKPTLEKVSDMLTEMRIELNTVKKENDEMKLEMKSLRKKTTQQENINKDINGLVEYLMELSKLQVVRTCEEMSQYGVNKSNYYFVDPDGPLTGQDPVWVFCSFTEKGVFTEISHNSEDKTEVDHCHDPGCYSRKVAYDAHQDQIQALIELSESCEQSIRYDCMLSPLMDEGINYAFWLDKNGEEQVYWDGEAAGEHLCACHSSAEGCVEEETLHTTCNCDAKVPQEMFDEGVIRSTSSLPILELRFGGMTYELQQGFHTLGKLKCQGKSQIPKADSCSALKQGGQFKSGYYNIKTDGENSKLVFCNMTSPGYNNHNNEEFVESSEDHFALVEQDIDDINTGIDDINTGIDDIKTDMQNLPGKWSGGSYCILASGSCPQGFTKVEGHLKGIKHLDTTMSYWMKSAYFGDSHVSCSHNSDGSCHGRDYAEFYVAACCK